MADAVPSQADIVSHPALLGAPPIQRRRRHWLAWLGFLTLVIAPTALCGWYLYTMAADRYASRTSFSIRSNETTAPLEIFGAITQLGTSSAVTDGQILYDFIQSQQIVDEVRATIPLEDIYNRQAEDPVFTLGRALPVEDMVEHWDRMTDIAIDPSTGILSFEARAFTPDDARAIAQAVLDASARLVNELSEVARSDAVRFAAVELEDAQSRLRVIRTRLRAFRDLEQEVDPTQNAEAAIGLVSALEEDLARAQVRRQSLEGVLNAEAPRLVTLKRQIETLQSRIAAERTRLGTGIDLRTGDARPLSDVVGDFEELVVDREFAEQAYTLALATYQQAEAEARRRHRYLAAHIRPTLSEEAEYPDREIWLGTIAALCFAVWSILVLIAGNVRERR